MARKKIKLELIANEAARRATFKKRRKGLMKKASELSTLCDVKACLIVYAPNEPTPEVWPSVPEAVRVLAKLKRMPEMEQSKKMMNQEGFMRARIAKLQDQLRKQDRENRELETTLLMYQSLMGMRKMDSVGIEEVTSLAWLIEMKVNEVKKRISDGCKRSSNSSNNNNNNNNNKKREGVIVKEEVKMKMKMKVEEEEKSAMEIAMDELQRQEWFTDIMNPPPPPPPQHEHAHHEHMVNVGGFPYSNTNMNIGNNNPWMDAFFPMN